MNALTNIQLEAQVIVERVADRQINEMKQRYNEYQEWIQIANNPIMRGYYEDDSINEYESIFKYIYMTKLVSPCNTSFLWYKFPSQSLSKDIIFPLREE